MSDFLKILSDVLKVVFGIIFLAMLYTACALYVRLMIGGLPTPAGTFNVDLFPPQIRRVN